MVFRFILRYLANNEQLVDKLANSYPVRRAAQWVVYVFTKNKSLSNKPEDIAQNMFYKFEDKLKKIRDRLEEQSKK